MTCWKMSVQRWWCPAVVVSCTTRDDGDTNSGCLRPRGNNTIDSLIFSWPRGNNIIEAFDLICGLVSNTCSTIGRLTLILCPLNVRLHCSSAWMRMWILLGTPLLLH